MSIQKKHFTSLRPVNLNEETMLPVDDDTPTFTSVSRYFYNYASLLLDFHNAMMEAAETDDAIRYAIILKFDGELRSICAETVPKALSPRIPINPAWPKWIKWARELICTDFLLVEQNVNSAPRDVTASFTQP
jgi:hypothetical protein